MDHFPGTLADVLATLHNRYLASITDADTDAEMARTWARTERANGLDAARALTRLGGQVWWQDRNPAGSCDDTPFLIASVDQATGLLRFDAARLDQMRELPNAGDFAADGEPIEMPRGG